MKKGTLEKPYPFGSPPVKCLNCDSKSFAIHLPKNLDEEYGNPTKKNEKQRSQNYSKTP